MAAVAWVSSFLHASATPRVFTLNDGTVAARVLGLQDAVEQLKALEKPFLHWTGKAERLSFDLPTLPLFVHERLSTAGIIGTLKGHQKASGLATRSQIGCSVLTSIATSG